MLCNLYYIYIFIFEYNLKTNNYEFNRYINKNNKRKERK